MTATTWWQDFRGQMPIIERWAYFDHAAVAPLPVATAQTIAEYAATFSGDGIVDWPKWRGTVETARKHAAQLIGAAINEIALVHNTTEGIGLIAEGFPWRPGDNLVLPENEFPSNLYPWLNLQARGVETRRVAVPNGRLDLDEIARACDERTRIVSVSWVGYASGWRTDLATLAELVHDRGACLFVDAIQGLGVFPLDVSQVPVDFLAADGHKWLLGPEGAGILFIRQDRLDMLRPLGVGWNSVRHAGHFTEHAFDLKPNAGRYEGGTYNIVGLAGLAASLELLLSFGVESISARVVEITDLLCDRLQAIGATVISHRETATRSGIVSFGVSGVDSDEVKRHCRTQGVVVSSRDGYVRASPHAYNDVNDLERLMEAIRDMASA